MKQKGKILGLLALGAVIPASMALVGCSEKEPPVTHSETSIYSHDETHHWHKCGCGTQNCDLKYDQEVHNYEMLTQENTATKTTKSYACDCGAIKIEESQTEEQMYNVAIELVDKYVNLEKTFTFKQGDYIAVSYDLNSGKILTQSASNMYGLSVKTGNIYKVYNTGSQTYTEVDATTYLNDLKNFMRDLKLPTYAEFDAQGTSSTITKNTLGEYTLNITLNVGSSDKLLFTYIFTDTSLKSISYLFGSERITLSFTDSFESELFNSFNVSGYTKVD